MVADKPNVSDAITITDSPSPNIRSFVNQSDSVTTSESVTPHLLSYINATDAVTTGEAFTPEVFSYVNVTDSIQVQTQNFRISDAVTMGESVAFMFVDFINVTDVVTVHSPDCVISDNVTMGDSFTVDFAWQVIATDTLTIGETATPFIGAYQFNLSDAIVISELVTLPLTARINVSDSATIGEQLGNSLSTEHPSGTDLITTSESVSMAVVSQTSFLFFKTLTIQTGEVPSTQTAFPALLPFILGDSDLRSVANGGHVQSSSGFDLRPYADSSLQQPLTYELVAGTYDPAIGAFEMWVQMTAQDGAVIYLAYGEPHISTDGSQALTWDSNFKAVFHLQNAVGGQFIGAGSLSGPIMNVPTPQVGGTDVSLTNSSASGFFTGAVNHGTTAGVGKTGGVALFSSSLSQYIALASGAVHFPPLTVSAWVLINSTGTTRTAFSKGVTGINTEWALYYDGVHAVFAANNGTIVGIVGTTVLVPFTWYHLVGTYDGSNWHLYLNGAADAAQVATVGPISTSAEYEIGALMNGSPAQFWDGAIGEVRLSNAARTGNWILTEYNNQSNLPAFWLTSAEAALGSVLAVDLVTMSDAVSVTIANLQVVASDQVTTSDSTTESIATFFLTESTTDLVTMGDSAAGSLTSNVNASDAVVTSEDIALVLSAEGSLIVSAAENLAIDESATLLITYYPLSIDEAVTTGESVAITITTLKISATEAMLVVETTKTVTISLISVSDHALMDDELTIGYILGQLPDGIETSTESVFNDRTTLNLLNERTVLAK